MNTSCKLRRRAHFRLLALLPACLLAWPVQSVAVIQAEYRIDGGAAQAMTLDDSYSRPEYTEETFTAEASAADLTVGPHYLELRMKGANDSWTPWRGRWFRVSGETHLVAAEWFVDTDPGAGNGVPIDLPADGAWDAPEEDLAPHVDTTNFTPGRHALYIRAKDSNGDWGILSTASFCVGEPLTIAAVEWTTDRNNWWGAGQPLPATDGAFDEPEEDVRVTTNSLALTDAYCASHTIYVRVQDSWGRWSTRHGMRWNPDTEQWDFDYAAGWGTDWMPITVQPDEPSQPSPGQSWLVVSSDGTVTFDWADCRGVSGYDLWVRRGLTEPFTLWGEGLSESSFTTNLADPAGTYAWMVRALGGDDCYRDGPIWEATVTTPKAGDTDGDGILDDWERAVFGPLFVANGTTDRDSDGRLDWSEAVAGTDPLDPADFLRIGPCRVVPGKYPQLGYPIGIAVDWPSAPDRAYTVYYATNLQTMGTIWQSLEQVTGSGAQMSSTNFWPEAAGFYRVEVSQENSP